MVLRLKKCLNSGLGSIVVQGSFSPSLDLYISRNETYCGGKLFILAARSIIVLYCPLDDGTRNQAMLNELVTRLCGPAFVHLVMQELGTSQW